MINIINRIRRDGGEAGWKDGQVYLRFRADLLTSTEVRSLYDREDELKRLLNPTTNNPEFPFQWSGESLGPCVALDCETTLITGYKLPDLVLVSVSDGEQTYCLKPSQVDEFIRIHADREYVCHNAAFDYRVVAANLEERNIWRTVANDLRLHDTMLMDQLIGLARSDAFPRNRDLGTVASQWAGMKINKDDPFRLRYAELIGQDWSTADSGFFSYAAADAEATFRCWHAMQPEARKRASCDRFGLLTESLQTVASIALAQITANGMRLDLDQVERSRESFQERLETAVRELQQLPGTDGLFRKDKRTGELKRSTSGKPRMDFGKLRQLLGDVADTNGFNPPVTPKGGHLTTSVKWWKSHVEADPFLRLWVELEQIAKLSQFFRGLKDERVHPRYQTLVRTGRTSCSGPNMQQLPRDGGFREMIQASPGTVLLTVDYSAVELRTLACICEKRYGQSRLADIFRDGIDPHCYTAAMFHGIELAEFNQMSKADRKPLRQKAKALNFGIPGGLGTNSLVAYAKQSYGVDLPFKEADEFRQMLITDVYPELSDYLSEDITEIVANNLKTTRNNVAKYLSEPVLLATKKIVQGISTKKSGEKYKATFIDRVWKLLSALNENSALALPLLERRTGESLHRSLFWSPVTTLTGRRRASVGFSQARNTPFQGLAADGAKLALWKLYDAEFRTVAFVHDEVVIELPEDNDTTRRAAAAVRIMTESMTVAMDSDIPIEVEMSLSRRWWKDAEELRDADGRLVCWEPGAAKTASV